MGTEASRITDNIWLSGRDVLANTDFFRTHPIDLIITAMTEEEVRDYGIKVRVKSVAPAAEWLWIPADDSENEEIYRYFFDVHTRIKEAERAGKKVLVHCAGGISRSPTLVIAHLMQAKAWTREQALEHVRKRREFVGPNDGFLRQLNLLERYLTQQ